MLTDRQIPLTHVPRRIAQLTGGPAPTYRQVYAGVLNGTVLAKQGGNGRYTVAEDDLPAIAAAFGMALRAAA